MFLSFGKLSKNSQNITCSPLLIADFFQKIQENSEAISREYYFCISQDSVNMFCLNVGQGKKHNQDRFVFLICGGSKTIFNLDRFKYKTGTLDGGIFGNL